MEEGSFAPPPEAFLTGFILLAGLIDDLRSKKIHNWLVLGLTALALVFIGIWQGPGGLLRALPGLGAAFAIGLPLNLMKVIGGGDLKLFMAAGLTMSFYDTFLVFACAMPYALILGIGKIVLDKKLRAFKDNLISIALIRRPDVSTLHSIPFSAALLLGFLSLMTLQSLP